MRAKLARDVLEEEEANPPSASVLDDAETNQLFAEIAGHESDGSLAGSNVGSKKGKKDKKGKRGSQGGSEEEH